MRASGICNGVRLLSSYSDTEWYTRTVSSAWAWTYTLLWSRLASMNTGASSALVFWLAVSTTCRLIGWVLSSPTCSGGITTVPFSLGSSVMIQRVVAWLSPPKVVSWLIWRVPLTSNCASRGDRSGLPNWVTSLDSTVSSTVSPELRRLRSTLATRFAAWAWPAVNASRSRRVVRRLIESCPDVVAVRTRICAAAVRRGCPGSPEAIAPGPGDARRRCWHRRGAAAGWWCVRRPVRCPVRRCRQLWACHRSGYRRCRPRPDLGATVLHPWHFARSCPVAQFGRVGWFRHLPFFAAWRARAGPFPGSALRPALCFSAPVAGRVGLPAPVRRRQSRLPVRRTWPGHCRGCSGNRRHCSAQTA